MKTKIILTLFAVVFYSGVTFAQDKTKLSEKQSNSDKKMEMNHGSANSGCCMTKDDKTEKTGSGCGMKSLRETTKMTESKSKNMEAIKTYTCSMHPDVKADKPGKCPKCGMELIEKE